MAGKYLIGLDVGGGGGRCLLVNAESGEWTSTFRSWKLSPAPEAGGFAYKMDLANVWQVLGTAVRSARQQMGIKPSDVVGIAAASMRHTTVAIDKKGTVLLAAPNRDARAAAQGMQLAIERDEEIYQLSGHTPSPIFLAARLLWMKETVPDLFKQSAAVMSISDWIGYKLSGEVGFELSQAGETLLLDLQSRKWSKELIKSLDLSPKILPALRQAGKKLGKLTKEAAAHLDLPPGIPVAVGGSDTQSGLVGSGIVEPGQVGVVAGTTTPVQMVLDRPQIDPEMRLWTGLHMIPDMYVLESNAGQMGSTLEWMARLIHPEAENPVARFATEAGASAPGAFGFHSTLGAAIFNSSAMEPPVDTLTFSGVVAREGEAGRADTARAVMEGMAYAVRANLDQIELVADLKATDLVLSGGMSRSPLWARIISDVLNRPVRVSRLPESTALGAAICAGVAAGVFPDLADGAARMSEGSQQLEPSPDSVIYQSRFADWMNLRQERRPADVVAINHFTEVMMSGLDSDEENLLTPVSIRPKIYISAEVDETALQKLNEIGDVTYKPYRQEGILLAGDHLIETLQGYQVFVTEVDLVDADVLMNLPDLRLVMTCRGNPVNVDIDACTLSSIPVINTPGRNADAVADLTVSFILMLARNLQDAAAFLRQPGGEAGDLGRMAQAHDQFLGSELWRKTIGVIGGGAIGRKVIQRLTPFGPRLLLSDPFLTEEQAAMIGVELVSLEQLLEKSDYISLHAPVTESTREMIDSRAFDLMKPGVFLTNTARAALIDHNALSAALASGKLGGYAADVFPVEPPAADDPILAFPNVIATPHMGGNTYQVAAHQGELIVGELERLMAGMQPNHILNPAVLDSFAWSEPRHQDERNLRERLSQPGPGATDLDLDAQKNKTVDSKASSIPEGHATDPSPSMTTKGKQNTMETNKASQTMVEIIQEFITAIEGDQEMIKFAKGKDVIFLFTVKDIEQSFSLSYVDGNVSTAMGEELPREPDVRLKMSADIFDGMFTGRVNATKAATSGKLSFAGDTRKAMSFIRIQGKMSRLYTAAREKIGDPGDLTALSAEPPSPPLAKDRPVSRQVVQAAPVIPSAGTGDVRDEILQVNNELYAKGLITATGGNVSARCEDNPNEIWITPSAIFKGDLRAEMMVRIDLDGNLIGDPDFSASSERRVHCAIYKLRPDIEAVVHSHAPQATLMALTGTEFQPISTESAFIGDLPVVPFIMPGTDELGDEVAQAIGPKGFAALMQNHGLVVAGSSLRRAADMTDVIEETSKKILTCKALGVEPPVLPDEVVKTLLEIGSMMA